MSFAHTRLGWMNREIHYFEYIWFNFPPREQLTSTRILLQGFGIWTMKPIIKTLIQVRLMLDFLLVLLLLFNIFNFQVPKYFYLKYIWKEHTLNLIKRIKRPSVVFPWNEVFIFSLSLFTDCRDRCWNQLLRTGPSTRRLATQSEQPLTPSYSRRTRKGM